MTYVLVQWVKTGSAAVFDVISVRDIVETKFTSAILRNAKDTSVWNTHVHVRWRGEKHPAKIIAVGTQTQMEKMCRQEIKRPETTCDGAAEPSNVICETCTSLYIENGDLKEQLALLQEENIRLKATIDLMTEQKGGIEEFTEAMRDSRLLHGQLQAAGTLRVNHYSGAKFQEMLEFTSVVHVDDLEDIGGCLVAKSVSKMLDVGPRKTASTYARELLRQVFDPAEFVNKSITGRQSNAHKGKDAKPQLDPFRMNAVIKYTCKKFGLIREAPIRQSLSSMLNKHKAEVEDLNGGAAGDGGQ
ncbi:uncharacterized protein LOC144128585 [Amblyomma americanum]